MLPGPCFSTLTQGGLPLPALPTVVTAAALSAQHPNQLAAVLLAGLIGAAIPSEPRA